MAGILPSKFQETRDRLSTLYGSIRLLTRKNYSMLRTLILRRTLFGRDPSPSGWNLCLPFPLNLHPARECHLSWVPLAIRPIHPSIHPSHLHSLSPSPPPRRLSRLQPSCANQRSRTSVLCTSYRVLLYPLDFPQRHSSRRDAACSTLGETSSRSECHEPTAIAIDNDRQSEGRIS